MQYSTIVVFQNSSINKLKSSKIILNASNIIKFEEKKSLNKLELLFFKILSKFPFEKIIHEQKKEGNLTLACS